MSQDASAPTLETERLRLRHFRATDIDAFAEMSADPEIMRFLGGRGVLDRSDAWRQMAMFAGHWQLRGYGVWAVEERESDTFVGRVGLHFPEGWPEPELAWTLAREHWGKGYAYEAARAALEYAFGTLGWKRLISMIDPDNHRSIRLAQRLGQSLEREIELRGHSLLLFAIQRPQETQ